MLHLKNGRNESLLDNELETSTGPDRTGIRHCAGGRLLATTQPDALRITRTGTGGLRPLGAQPGGTVGRGPLEFTQNHSAMKNRAEKIIAGLFTILSLLVWSAVACQAQFPDCCQQAATYKDQLDQITIKYNESIRVLTETRQAGDEVISQKNNRITQLEKEANTKLTSASGRETDARNAYKQTTTNLEWVRKELQDELVKNRLFGWGRRRWIRNTLNHLP
jgi:hypothetical protein